MKIETLFVGISASSLELVRFTDQEVLRVRCVEPDWDGKDPYDYELDHINGDTYYIIDLMVVNGHIEKYYDVTGERLTEINSLCKA